ncbi:RNA polymerase sigma factor SigI [Falsibacillus albus]|uniref:RNA polymerase sigma factor SigI n=1 Tax=Falsibacillus albus TaxID=2478915 RepID=A0A3L7K202_9BACI|nr:RNA polymerase sigma factor SigI [Falsibacillus albus]RLQ97117.1 RNA polymerase sigma factor SigI [Falsibacillus albus]
MLSLLFMARKKKKSLEDLAVDIQKGNEEALNAVLDSYKPFVKKTVSSVCKKYISESDDEFSIGLMAFHDSIQKYEHKKGTSLISFSEVIIKRRVIDYIRKNAKFKDISMTGSRYENEDDHPSVTLEDTLSLEEFQKKEEQQRRKEEIIQFQQLISSYDVTFDDLLNQSPKHEDARVNAIHVAQTILENEEFMDHLLEKKQLPIKKLEKKVKVSRKTIERNRKYIIAVALILYGDFIYLKEYLKGRLGL